MAGIVALGRIAYTQYQHRHPDELKTASNAEPLGYSLSEATIETADGAATQLPKEEVLVDAKEVMPSSPEADPRSLSPPRPTTFLANPIAIYPQYITQKPTTLTISETSLPNLPSGFAITTTSSVDLTQHKEIFRVHRSRPSLHHDQTLIDATTSKPIFTIRRDVGTLPRGYRFEDPSNGNTILHLPGSFFVPTHGARANASFIDAVSGATAHLYMKGSWRNRHAAISMKLNGSRRPSGTSKTTHSASPTVDLGVSEVVIANMDSELLNAKNLVGGRRNYTVNVAGGVDMAMIVGMVVALDART